MKAPTPITGAEIAEAAHRLPLRSEVKPNGCIEWTGYRNADGYGVISVGRRRLLTNRAAYAVRHGSIPAGKFICHSCDNPACINPDHLWAGEPKDNSRDMARKGRCGSKPGTNAGESNGFSKITAEIAREIFAARRAGESGRAIAARYGIGTTIVYDIANRRRWTSAVGATAD